MNGFDSNDPRDEALWRVLGRAREITPSPFFARRVRRAVEGESAPAAFSWRAFLLRIFAPTAVCAGLAMAAFVGVQRDAASNAIAGNEIEFETIQSLDLLVSNYESSLWLDPSSPY
jgi:hypothetical protein